MTIRANRPSGKSREQPGTRRPGNDVSVVIPTHLPRSLEHTLLGLSRQTEPGFEVIVVENGVRSDVVSTSCRRWQNKLNLCYTFDPRSGLNRARNTGARLASGRYVALIDDDCSPGENWVRSILLNQCNLADAAAMGGPVRLEFETSPPDWLIGEFRTCLSELDRGPVQRLLGDGEFLFGANMAFSKSIFERTGGFPEGIGMHTRNPPQLANDEIVFLEESIRLARSGLLYCPDMGVAHRIPASRLSMDRMFQRRFGQGLSDVALMRRRHGPNSDKPVTRYLNSMFPHPWHCQQFKSHLQKLEPKASERYLNNHVICRTGYLWGYRQALSKSHVPLAGDRITGLPMDIRVGRCERFVRGIARTGVGGERPNVAANLAELMYRRDVKGQTTEDVDQADDKLCRLIAMARLLEPGLFKNPIFGQWGSFVF